jgi:SAM-dependent methyltransferase
MHLSILTILLAALSCLSAFGFQPDSNTKAYKATVDQLLSNSATFAPPVDPGPPNYWFHPKIHTFGNHGVLGAVHATVAPLATKLIDVVAYEGENVRNQICQRLQEERVSTNEPRIVDLACGVGMSTRALQKSFPFAKQIVGLDTSPEMIHMAKAYTDPTSIPSKAMDIVTKVLYQVKGLHGPALPETSATSTVPPTDYLQANAEDTGLEKASVDLVTIM